MAQPKKQAKKPQDTPEKPTEGKGNVLVLQLRDEKIEPLNLLEQMLFDSMHDGTLVKIYSNIMGPCICQVLTWDRRYLKYIDVSKKAMTDGKKMPTCVVPFKSIFAADTVEGELANMWRRSSELLMSVRDPEKEGTGAYDVG